MNSHATIKFYFLILQSVIAKTLIGDKSTLLLTTMSNSHKTIKNSFKCLNSLITTDLNYLHWSH
jgi:hypothetical protein